MGDGDGCEAARQGWGRAVGGAHEEPGVEDWKWQGWTVVGVEEEASEGATGNERRPVVETNFDLEAPHLAAGRQLVGPHFLPSCVRRRKRKVMMKNVADNDDIHFRLMLPLKVLTQPHRHPAASHPRSPSN